MNYNKIGFAMMVRNLESTYRYVMNFNRYAKINLII